MKAWKLTDANDKTRGPTQWGENVERFIRPMVERPTTLCSDGWFHFYRHPVLAVIMNPIHADFDHPHLWECEADGELLHDGWLKSGCTQLTTLKRVPLPEVSPEKRIEFAIRCVMSTKDPRRQIKSPWEQWAEAWMETPPASPATTSVEWMGNPTVHDRRLLDNDDSRFSPAERAVLKAAAYFPYRRAHVAFYAACAVEKTATVLNQSMADLPAILSEFEL